MYSLSCDENDTSIGDKVSISSLWICEDKIYMYTVDSLTYKHTHEIFKIINKWFSREQKFPNGAFQAIRIPGNVSDELNDFKISLATLIIYQICLHFAAVIYYRYLLSSVTVSNR